MVCEFGLSEAVGPVSYAPATSLHPALAGPRGYSERTQWLVDQEISALLSRAETRARELLSTHRHALEKLTSALLEQETVTGEQVRAIAAAAAAEPPSSTAPTPEPSTAERRCPERAALTVADLIWPCPKWPDAA